MSLLRADPVVTRYGYTGALICYQELSTDHPATGSHDCVRIEAAQRVITSHAVNAAVF